MSDWKRTTKEAPFENLRPEMVVAIKEHIEQYNLGAILSDALFVYSLILRRSKAFIGLDDGVVGMKFKEIVFKAVQDAKK